MSPPDLPPRTEAELRLRQAEGQLRVRRAAHFRRLVHEVGLEEAYGQTDVVVAATAEFTSHASLHLSLGPTDPPIRLRDPQLGGVTASPAGAGTDLILPIGGGKVLAEWLADRPVELSATGEGTTLFPRRELHTLVRLDDIASGQLLLPRAISENGVVAVSGAEGMLPTPYGPLMGPWAQALYTCQGPTALAWRCPAWRCWGQGRPCWWVAPWVGLWGPGGGTNPTPSGWWAAMPALRGPWRRCASPCTGCGAGGCARAGWRARAMC